MEEVQIIGKEKETLMIKLSGDIDLGNAEAFYQAVMDVYQQAPASITFDCEGLDFIDSTTLGTFVKILKALKLDGYQMKLVKLQPKIKKLFLICSLNSIMEIA